MAEESVRSMVIKQIRPALVIFFLLTLITGIVYPLVITGIAQLIFPGQANGSLIEHNGHTAGSSLIGQPFSSPGYFWDRVSATSPVPYNADGSAGSNLGPANPALVDEVKARADALHAADPSNTRQISVDLVTSSGSGLDPDISVAAADYQVSRIARERNLSEADVRALVAAHTLPRQFGFLGEPRVRVLPLNLALDDLGAGRITIPQAAATAAQHDLPPSPIFGMKMADWLQLAAFFAIIILLLVPAGSLMTQVLTGQPNAVSSLFAPLERRLFAVAGINPDDEMDWKQFSVAMMIFSILGIAVTFVIQEIQQYLPLNPAGIGPVAWDLSLNTAVSFATNTNWQAYAGETGVSYLTQMTGLATHNFFSAAMGIAVLVSLISAFTRRSSATIGNFWTLFVRSIWILLPISFIIAMILVWQGIPQTLAGPVTVPLLDPVKDSSGALVSKQTIALGPAASQIAIKMLGTNGGGFWNANAAHPFENPTPLSNFVEMFAMLIIPAGLCYMFGKMIGSVRKGIALLIAMTLIFLPLLGMVIWAETSGNPAFTPLGVDQGMTSSQPGGNMEGKEVRFGIVPSALFSVLTTAMSCGAVNSMHDSFMPLVALSSC